ncbi:MAG: substrate-binding domain-containing protein [Psychromonas sp.]
MAKSTIYDVAKHAHVSSATVSRYLNQSSYVEREKVKAIEHAIFELNYQPLRKRQGQRSMTLGIIAPNFDSSFVSEFLTGIDKKSSNYNYRVLIETKNMSYQQEVKLLKSFKEQKLDGVIIVVGVVPFDVVKSILSDIPALFVCRERNSFYPVIGSDNTIGGMIATNHLIQLGHKKIIHLFGNEANFDSLGRKQGYLKSMQDAGLKVTDNMLLNGDFSLDGGFNAINSLLQSQIDFTAIFAGNDLSAFGAIRALHEKGYRVPEDISVIGFDDHPMCRFTIPQLTTIKQPLVEIGEQAFEAILDIISDNYNGAKIKPFAILPRESTCQYSSS